MSDITKDQVIEWLSNQSVLEIAGLVKDLEEKWGVSAAAPVAVAAAAPAEAAAASSMRAKSFFVFPLPFVPVSNVIILFVSFTFIITVNH